MHQTTGISGPAPPATFNARVAGVGLVTTLVGWIAACLTSLLQQWAVARTQSHQMQVSLAQVTATTEAPAMAGGETHAIQAPVLALAASKTVEAARLTDLKGSLLASFQRAPTPGAAWPLLFAPALTHEGVSAMSHRLGVAVCCLAFAGLIGADPRGCGVEGVPPIATSGAGGSTAQPSSGGTSGTAGTSGTTGTSGSCDAGPAGCGGRD